MARLHEGERKRRLQRVVGLIRCSGLGLSEREIAQELGWERRTVNNYLHELDREEQAHREGRRWFPG